MADTTTAPKQEPATEPVPAAPGKGSALMRINILLFLVVMIVGECLVAMFLLPTASETVAATQGQAAKPEEASKKEHDSGAKKEKEHGAKKEKEHGAPAKKGHEGGAKEEHAGGEEAPAAEQIEVDLGEFTVTSFQPTSNSTLRIDFHLYGIVANEAQKKFTDALAENKQRFREQVLTIVRSTEMADLTDASLSLVKRKIHEQSNRMLGKPLLESVIISDFSFIEQ